MGMYSCTDVSISVVTLKQGFSLETHVVGFVSNIRR